MGERDLNRRKRKHHLEEEHSAPLAHDESNWLVSYADMMTLLFGFFVLMYSMTQFDNRKFELVSKEIAKYFGGNIQANGALLLVEQKIINILKGSGDMNGVEVSKGHDDTIVLNFNGDLLFESGAIEVSEAAKPLLRRAIGSLKSVGKIEQIMVEGHTDADPVSSGMIKSNWELSALRAGSVVRYFELNGVDSNILSAVGMGSSKPLVPHFDAQGVAIPENKAKNRRVSLTVKLADPEAAMKLQQKEFQKVLTKKEKEDAIKKSELEDKMRLASLKFEEAQARYKAAQEEKKRKAQLEKIERQIQSLEQKTNQYLEKVDSQGTEVKNPEQKNQ